MQCVDNMNTLATPNCSPIAAVVRMQEAVPEQQARKRPHSPVPARKAGDGERAVAKLQKVESGGKAELRQPSGCGAGICAKPSTLPACHLHM
jgi:hypothetical protein